jgi:hypothetical protein
MLKITSMGVARKFKILEMCISGNYIYKNQYIVSLYFIIPIKYLFRFKASETRICVLLKTSW